MRNKTVGMGRRQNMRGWKGVGTGLKGGEGMGMISI